MTDAQTGADATRAKLGPLAGMNGGWRWRAAKVARLPTVAARSGERSAASGWDADGGSGDGRGGVRMPGRFGVGVGERGPGGPRYYQRGRARL